MVTAYFDGCGTECADFITAQEAFPAPISRNRVNMASVVVIGQASEHPDIKPLAQAGPPLDEEAEQVKRNKVARTLASKLGYRSDEDNPRTLLLAFRGTAVLAFDTTDVEILESNPDSAWNALPSAFDFGDLTNVTAEPTD